MFFHYFPVFPMTFRRLIFAATIVLLQLGCSNSNQPTKIDGKDSVTQDETSGEYELVWHWEDDFDGEEKEKLMDWIEQTYAAVKRKIGAYPFDVHVFFHRIDGYGEPVPWAHTKRGNHQSVHFHVDMSFSLQEFLSDWTAPHEISHLAIPFLGKNNSWFAEGFATYLQYQVMLEMNKMDSLTLQQKYADRLTKAKSDYLTENPVALQAMDYSKEHRYSTMYWGGVSFFYHADQLLQLDYNTSFCELVGSYLHCCRLEGQNLQELMRAFDDELGDSVFVPLLDAYQSIPGLELVPVIWP